MLLAVDIGNTFTKFGIFNGEDLVDKFSAPTLPNSSIETIRSHLSDDLGQGIANAIVCSVVPEATVPLINFLKQKKIQTIVATNDLDYGLVIRYGPLSAIGTDRLVNVLATLEKYGSPAIVCSFGTATTLDVVDGSGVFLGGIIAAGMQTAAEALNLKTSQLPKIVIERPEKVIGTSTVSAIRSGIVFGHIGMAEGLITRITGEIGETPVVVATGGFASLVASMTEQIDTVDEDLTLNGLRILFSRINHT